MIIYIIVLFFPCGQELEVGGFIESCCCLENVALNTETSTFDVN